MWRRPEPPPSPGALDNRTSAAQGQLGGNSKVRSLGTFPMIKLSGEENTFLGYKPPCIWQGPNVFVVG